MDPKDHSRCHHDAYFEYVVCYPNPSLPHAKPPQPSRNYVNEPGPCVSPHVNICAFPYCASCGKLRNTDPSDDGGNWDIDRTVFQKLYSHNSRRRAYHCRECVHSLPCLKCWYDTKSGEKRPNMWNLDGTQKLFTR